MRASIALAQNTFREALRERLVLLASVVALALVGASNLFLKIDLGHEKLKFVFDFTSGALSFFGSAIAIILTCKVFFAELENRTVIPLLSKPISRCGFVFGKFMGAASSLFVFSLAIALVGALMLVVTLNSFSKPPTLAPNFIGFFAFCFLQWTKLCALSAITLLICAASSSMMFAAVISFLIFAGAMMSSATIFLGSNSFSVTLARYVFPDFPMFALSEFFAFEGIDLELFFITFGYALTYSTVCCGLASAFFSRREF